MDSQAPWERPSLEDAAPNGALSRVAFEGARRYGFVNRKNWPALEGLEWTRFVPLENAVQFGDEIDGELSAV